MADGNRRTLVSAIVPVYNGAPYIQTCYDSLAEQTMQEIEIIFVDDGSTDNTKQIIEEICSIDDRVRVLSKINEGQGIARNYGLDFARGEYVSFIDVDDKLPRDAYESLYAFTDNSTVDAVYGLSAAEGFKEAPTPMPTGVYADDKSLSEIAAMIVGGLPDDPDDSVLGMSVCRCIFRREFLNEGRVRFVSERLVNSEDLLFNMDVLSLCAKAALVNKVVYTICYDVNPSSYSKRYDSEKLAMFIRLRSEMMERVARCERFCGFEPRVERRFLANCRVLTKLASFAEGTLKNHLSDIDMIISHPRFAESLIAYPINHLPIKQRLFFTVSKYHRPLLVYALILARYRRTV